MKFRKQSNRSPDVIVKFGYQKANAHFVNYTDDKDKTKEEIETEISPETENVTDWKKFISYTDRKQAATTPMFNSLSNNMSADEKQDLIKQVNQAQDNSNLLWSGVLSFSNEFLEEQGIKKGDKIDQARIKECVRKSLPDILKKEGIDDSAVWWGNIHLNTEHVHVHLGITEIDSKREEIFNARTKKIEPKGNFSMQNIRTFKSVLHGNLLKPEIRNSQIEVEKSIGSIRDDLVKSISTNSVPTDKLGVHLMNDLINNLPKDKSKWRYGSNAKDFKIAKSLLRQNVKHYLETERPDEFSEFKQSVEEQAAFYKNAYEKGYDEKQFINDREEELFERLGNRLLKDLKENLPDTEETQKLTVNDFKQLPVEDLNEMIDEFENAIEKDSRSKEQTKLINTMKQTVRSINLSNEHDELEDMVNFLDKAPLNDTTKNLIEMKKKEYLFRLQANNIMRKPTFKRSDIDKTILKEFNQKYPDVVKSAPDKLDKTFGFAERKKQELLALENIKDKTLLEKLYGSSDKKVIEKQLKTDLKTFDLKIQIQDNNKKLKQFAKGSEEFKELKRSNGKLFNELNGLSNDPKVIAERKEREKIARKKQRAYDLKRVAKKANYYGHKTAKVIKQGVKSAYYQSKKIRYKIKSMKPMQRSNGNFDLQKFRQEQIRYDNERIKHYDEYMRYLEKRENAR
jgi:hypothetical protein